MSEPLQAQVEMAVEALAALPNLTALEAWRVEHLGKSSAVMAAAKSIGALPPAERGAAGKAINESRAKLEALYAEKKETLAEQERLLRLEADRADPGLPGAEFPYGTRHPIRIVLEDLRAIFAQMGFSEAQGPEVESDEYNFGLLNMPEGHPARDMWDTFYTQDRKVLRTHTSPVQIRAMKIAAPAPLKIICPGRVFRYEQITARTECMFHQVEGLEVGPQVTMRHLLGTLQGFARALFGGERKIRVRNSYFPFTEPSIEVDVDCFNCNAKGCNLCKHTTWIEILGAGMVHPTVLRNGGYDPDEVSGYAFGLGVERIAMLRYAITDIRHFYRNDLRFLYQFRPAA